MVKQNATTIDSLVIAVI